MRRAFVRNVVVALVPQKGDERRAGCEVTTAVIRAISMNIQRASGSDAREVAAPAAEHPLTNGAVVDRRYGLDLTGIQRWVHVDLR